MSTATESFIRFAPIYQKRVWGGRSLESRYGRELPDADSPFGESWEISAREEADSVAVNGPFAGKTLTELWGDPETRATIFGADAPAENRFPLLCKILDARDKLSIQVHPPASIAAELGGEPKTEVWYIAHADPGAELYVGVKRGVDVDSFRIALETGEAESSVHAIPVAAGDHIFIPSGRLHAIGAGMVIYEIQQNSDTTYRVYDWNRVGMNGEPRDLHIEESLKCIDFDDVEPTMDSADGSLLCECEHFRLERHAIASGGNLQPATDGRFAIVTITKGEMGADTTFKEGDFFIVPAGSDASTLVAADDSEVLLTTWP